MKGGLLNEVKAICKEWKIQDVTGSYVNPKQLKTEIENAIKHKVLIETFKAKSAISFLTGICNVLQLTSIFKMFFNKILISFFTFFFI